VDVLLRIHELRKGLRVWRRYAVGLAGGGHQVPGAVPEPGSRYGVRSGGRSERSRVGGRGDDVGRPFSYQGGVTAPGGSADPREDGGGTRPMAAGGDDLYADGPRRLEWNVIK
jgi:hypothetical protein